MRVVLTVLSLSLVAPNASASPGLSMRDARAAASAQAERVVFMSDRQPKQIAGAPRHTVTYSPGSCRRTSRRRVVCGGIYSVEATECTVNDIFRVERGRRGVRTVSAFASSPVASAERVAEWCLDASIVSVGPAT